MKAKAETAADKGKIEIREFKLRDIKTNTTILLIGRRGSGKTTFNRWLFYYMKKKIRLPYIISSTAEMTHEYDQYVPQSLIFKEYEPEKMFQLLAHQDSLRKASEAGDPRYKGKVLDALVLFDDCIGRGAKWTKDENVKEIIYNGRHYFITFIASIQQPLALPSEYRDNIDYIIITKINTDKEKKKVYENYWNSEFGNYHHFLGILEECTRDHRCLLINNKAMGSGAAMKDCIFFIKNHDPKYLPRFRIGSKKVWHLHERLYNPNWIGARYDAAHYGTPGIPKIVLNSSRRPREKKKPDPPGS